MKPPSAAQGASLAGTSAPSIPDAASAGATAAAAAAPTAQPPGAANARPRGGNGAAAPPAELMGGPPAARIAEVTPATGSATGTWQSGVTVDALWSINQIRNAFMHVVNIGWVKIFNGSDGAFTALTTLASQARQTGRPINYRQEADGMVHEIYLW
jgi:hypothetical protein